VSSSLYVCSLACSVKFVCFQPAFSAQSTREPSLGPDDEDADDDSGVPIPFSITVEALTSVNVSTINESISSATPNENSMPISPVLNNDKHNQMIIANEKKK